jgi:hypothetical protein
MSQVLFTTTNTLTIERIQILENLDILALSGGKFGSLRIIATFFFSFFMPHLRGLHMFEILGEVKQKK